MLKDTQDGSGAGAGSGPQITTLFLVSSCLDPPFPLGSFQKKDEEGEQLTAAQVIVGMDHAYERFYFYCTVFYLEGQQISLQFWQ